MIKSVAVCLLCLTQKVSGIFLGGLFDSADYSSDAAYDYRYDSVGNRLQQIIGGDTTSYTYDAANRLTAVTPSTGSGSSYTYDDNGNRLSDGTATNTWDSANRLTAVVSGQSAAVSNVYDGLGNRVAQVQDGQRTDYALDVAAGLPEVVYTSPSTGSGQGGNKYLHLPGVIMTESASGEVRYLLSDGLGSIRHATDVNGAVVSYHEYDPYGNPPDDAPRPTQYGFTGEWWQADIGLLHLRARWYDPGSGTFLSRDAVESEPPYQYVRGNVVNRVDPSGLCGEFAGTGGGSYNVDLAICVEGGGGIGPVVAAGSLIIWALNNPEVQQAMEEGAEAVQEKVEELTGYVMSAAEIRELYNRPSYDPNQPEPRPAPEPIIDIHYLPRPTSTPDDDCDDEDKVGYDLAFGVGTHLFGFANSFQKPTYMFLDWPDEIVQDEAGNILQLANPSIFRTYFHSIMVAYFSRVPDGRLKFNLEDMDNTRPKSLTTWELREISTRYYSKVDYYS